MISLDNNAAERMIHGPALTRKNTSGSRTDDPARLPARVWTVTATIQITGLNPLTYLTAYPDEGGHTSGKPPSGPTLEPFPP